MNELVIKATDAVVSGKMSYCKFLSANDSGETGGHQSGILISKSAKMDEMQAEKVILVVPKPYILAYPKDRRDRIWTLGKFIAHIMQIEGLI